MTIEDIVQPIYDVFSKYTLNKDMGYCPCCVAEVEAYNLCSKDMRISSEEDLRCFVANSPYTWGSLEDWKHFLPRILELEMYKGESNCLSGKLEYGGFDSWPENEQQSIKTFLMEYFFLLIVNEEYSDAKDWLEHCGGYCSNISVDNDLLNDFWQGNFLKAINGNDNSCVRDYFKIARLASPGVSVEKYFFLKWPEDEKGILSFAEFLYHDDHYYRMDQQTKDVTKNKIFKMKANLENYWYENIDNKNLPCTQTECACYTIDLLWGK